MKAIIYIILFIGMYKCIKLFIEGIKEVKEKNKPPVQEKQQVIQTKIKYYTPRILTPTRDSKYVARTLLTENEQDFYNKIKEYIYSQGLHIITKIRLADLIEPKVNQYQNRSEWQTNFNKINAKHIDFAIVNDKMQILFLIELDDKTHNYKDRQERDEFVNTALVNAGYTLLRVYNKDEGVSNIINYLEKNF